MVGMTEQIKQSSSFLPHTGHLSVPKKGAPDGFAAIGLDAAIIDAGRRTRLPVASIQRGCGEDKTPIRECAPPMTQEGSPSNRAP